jgi:aspartyl-tRNA(Asn)/glutamyl-tRNA(Gln) amidotransferase subunit A
VSRYGVMPLDFSLDHMGPLTRSVRDAAAVLDLIAGHDRRDETSSKRPVDKYAPPANPSISGFRIGVPDNFYFEKVDPAVATAIGALAVTSERLGAHVDTVHVPDMAAYNAVSRVILLVEASALMEPFMDRRSEIGADVLALLDQGRLLPATDYVNAQRLRRVMQREFAALWTKVDCLLTPTTPCSAARIGDTKIQIGGQEEDVRLASTRFVRAINLLGLPALAFPCGLDDAGMPISAQIIGKPFSEAALLRAGAALEEVAPFIIKPRGITS